MFKKIFSGITTNLQLRIFVLLTSILLLLLAIFVYAAVQVQRTRLEDALLQKGKSMAITGAATMGHLLDDAIASGRLSTADVFSTDYQPIPNTDPQKYHTAYDEYTDQSFLTIEDSFLEDADVIFAAAVDKKGYLPTHNTRFSAPLTGDYQTDLVGNRSKRIFDDPVGLAAAQNTEPVLHQVYHRDTGEVMWDISAPIMVDGQHWGGFRIGFSLVRVQAQVNELVVWLLTAAALLAAVLGLVIFFVTRWLVKPISLLSRVAAHLSVGEVDQQFTFARRDELGQLADAFRRMINYQQEIAGVTTSLARGDLTVTFTPKSANDRLGQAVNRMIANLHQLVAQVADNAENVSVASEQLAVTAEQSGQAIQQIAASSHEQARGVAQTVHFTGQISQAIQQVVDNAQWGADGASDAAQLAQDGVQAVESNLKGMHSIKAKVDVSAQKVREMGKRSEQIGAIVETIDSIASQTNLLALNAAIEAARAGEHGKGFAVVADEVRKLAEKSASAAQEVGGLIKGIQTTVDEAVTAMEEGAGEVGEGVSQAQKSGEVLAAILNAAQGVNQQVDEIAAAAEQMNASADEMVGAIDNVSAVVEENTAASEQMSAQVEEVTASAQSLREMAVTLQDLTAQFSLSHRADHNLTTSPQKQPEQNPQPALSH